MSAAVARKFFPPGATANASITRAGLVSCFSRAGAQRCMSIMERYRRLRPAPDPISKPWATPSEFLAGGDGTDLGEKSHTSIADEQTDQSNISASGAPRRPPIYARAPVPKEALFSSWERPTQPAEPRSLLVGLAGPPNAGKSSLMNEFLDCPVSAVSPKVNTTRDGVRGIKTMGSSQLIFLDVPGIIPSEQRRYNRDLVAKAWQGYQECELCLLVIDVVKRPTQETFDMVRRLCPREDIGETELRIRKEAVAEIGAPASWLPRPLPGGRSEAVDRPPVVLVLNKIDKMEEFRWVQAREREFRAHGHFKKVFYVSATRRQGLWKLLEHLKSECRPRPWTYPSTLRTTLPYVEQLKHQINTFLFKWFNSDVPYKIEHQTLGWTPRLDGSLLIEHELIVQDSVVARMVLGTRNTLVVRLRDQVSYKLRKMWGMPVEVQIWVTPLRQRLSMKDRAAAGRRPS